VSPAIHVGRATRAGAGVAGVQRPLAQVVPAPSCVERLNGQPLPLRLKGTQSLDSTSSSKIVLTYEPAQHIARSNARTLGRPWSRIRLRVRRFELKTSVRPSLVVVGS
jgi:hypothetical protein